MSSNLEAIFSELEHLSEKTHLLALKTRTLVSNIDAETRHVKTHIANIKKILGPDVKMCSICDEQPPDTAVDKCFHVFCKNCAQKALRSRRCHICRGDVKSIFKIFI
jgi:hypothetical protein